MDKTDEAHVNFVQWELREPSTYLVNAKFSPAKILASRVDYARTN